MLTWLNSNAGAVQALAACATFILTGVLVVITVQYVRITRGALLVSQKQLRIQYQPQLSVWIGEPIYDPNEGDYVEVLITNSGTNPFRLDELWVHFHCNFSKDSQSPPHKVEYASNKVFPSKDFSRYRVPFDANDCYDPAPHGGPCEFVHCADVKVSDIFGFEQHQYSFDGILGLHYIADCARQPWRTDGPISQLRQWFKNKTEEMERYDAGGH